MKNYTSLLLILFLFASCKKKVDCDATLCVKNIGNDTIHYSWGSSAYEDSILPGKSACKNVGHIEIDGSSESTITAYFDSDHGNYAIKVDECEENHEIE